MLVYNGNMGSIPRPLRTHIATLLIALAFLLAQFIVETLVVYGLMRFLPNIGTFLYTSKEVVVVIHLGITALLISIAKSYSRKLYA